MVSVTDRPQNDLKHVEGRKTEIEPKKNFPMWCNVNFESILTAINYKKAAEKTDSKLTLHHMGIFFI